MRDSREALLDNLANYGGLWKTKLQMDNEIGEKSNTQQLAALKTQINARKKIIQQKGTHELFAFSSNKRPLPLDKLKANLVILMQPSHSNEASTI